VNTGHNHRNKRNTLIILLKASVTVYLAVGYTENLQADYTWLNQVQGPRPACVWENREDVIYHDLSYNKKEVQNAPEIAPFMQRVWVFNTAMQWHRRPEGILCYSKPATLLLTGEHSVSDWHSDPVNEILSHGRATTFVKRSTNRRRDCAVLPAFQFHLGQNPILTLDVDQATDDWQFVVSVKGRSGTPLLSSGWRNGPATVNFNLAEALTKKGFDLNYAELHFVIGTWTKTPEDKASISFELILPGRTALVASLPVVRTVQQVDKSGVPIAAVLVDDKANLLTAADKVRISAKFKGKKAALEEKDGIWTTKLSGLTVGDYPVTLTAEGAAQSQTQLYVRITDGEFWQYDKQRHLFSRNRKIPGPLSGSYQGNVFVRIAGEQDEALVQGQKAWDRWDRSKAPGEHLHYWEALTTSEMDERFAYLKSCGWDLLHVCQHWGIWERLDAGGRIAPHGAEQIALYLRTAGRHGMAVIQALTHYEYATRVNNWHGTVPFRRYLDAGFESEDFLRPGRNPKFEKIFRRYLSDYVSLFKEETALFAMTASGEGDATIGHARAHDIFDFVRRKDRNHIFMGEPTHLLHKVPRSFTAGWRQDVFGGRTYAIAGRFLPEYDLGVEMKLYQLGRLSMAEGSWGASNIYAAFHHHALEDGWPDESWVGSDLYRVRLRDSLYLGLAHRLPKMVTWEEQIAEDEHRLIPVIRKHVDWTKPFQTPGVAVKLASDDISAEHREVLVQYEKAFSHLDLSYLLLHHDDPTPSDVEVVFDASAPYIEPFFASAGGTVPDKLKGSRPLIVTGNYALNYTWSRDRNTLLAYVYNVAGHFERSLPLAGRFYRKALPVELKIQIQSLPKRALKLRLYDVNEQNVHTEADITGDTTLDIGRTSHDYFVLITPG